MVTEVTVVYIRAEMKKKMNTLYMTSLVSAGQRHVMWYFSLFIYLFIYFFASFQRCFSSSLFGFHN